MPFVPAVAIEIPAEIAPELAAVVLHTCDLALGSGRCVLAEVSPLTTSTNWLAHVGMEPNVPNLYRIELRDALPRETRTTYSRALTFDDGDAPIHRWSTVGVVVAALVISAEAGEGPGDSLAMLPRQNSAASDNGSRSDQRDSTIRVRRTPQPSHGETVRSAGDEQNDTNSQRPLAVRLDFGGLVGPGIYSNAARFGLILRPSIELTENLDLWIQVAGSHAADTVDVSWWSGAMGLGLVADVIPRRVAAGTRVAVVRDRINVTVTDEAGAHDSASRWRYGAGAGLDTVLSLADSLGLFVAVDGMLLSPRVKIRLAGAEVGASPTIEAVVTAGMRWRIPFGR